MYNNYAKIRDTMGLKDSDISRMTGIARATLSDWKRDVSTPKLDKLAKIAKCLNVSIEGLLGTEDIVFDEITRTWSTIEPDSSNDEYSKRLMIYWEKLNALDKQRILKMAEVFADENE